MSLIFTMTILAAFAEPTIEKRTFTYTIKEEADTLKLDRYSLESQCTERPAVMFVFGGSFRSGARDAADYTDYFNFLANQGYVVVSIDYRTGMKDFKASDGIGAFASGLQKSVAMAVEDLFTATSYIIENSRDWGIDSSQITISGSSAGAITVMQAEYAIANSSPLASILPSGFNYAGVISFAGAILSETEPHWGTNPCPILLFHGDADTVVPFDKATIDDVAGIYGSQYISSQLSEIESPYELYVIKGSGHETATSPMKSNLYEILSFLKESVAGHQNRIIRCEQSTPGAPTDYKTEFTIMDYIRANMPQQ